jgi:hypothetical protein
MMMQVGLHPLSGRVRLERCQGGQQGRDVEDVDYPLEMH